MIHDTVKDNLLSDEQVEISSNKQSHHNNNYYHGLPTDDEMIERQFHDILVQIDHWINIKHGNQIANRNQLLEQLQQMDAENEQHNSSETEMQSHATTRRKRRRNENVNRVIVRDGNSYRVVLADKAKNFAHGI